MHPSIVNDCGWHEMGKKASLSVRETEVAMQW